MKKRLLIGFVILFIFELIMLLVLFFLSHGKAKIYGLLMVMCIAIFLYWFLNLALYGFRKIGTLTFCLFLLSIGSILFVIGAIFETKKTGFDSIWAVILPFPIITISWIIAEYRGEE